MRFAPAAAALSLMFAVTASVGQSAQLVADPRAAALVAEGRGALAAGDTQRAVDAFEAALAADPAYTPIFIDLAEAARREGLPGKAIALYREALERDPDNLVAMAGVGRAMLEKGAVEKARATLAKLESVCGSNCAETRQLAAAIAQAPQPRTLAAESVMPEPVVTQN
ncbi:tetratricopeptide repeat protein [Altererythrobacter aquiaggeris]|uniref:tetratricopeptide repeat protein n=1 Tax=Aestuarierythrobacter aquiaggeris TaxID=1898396 RepID=UPI00301A349E